MTVEFRRDCYTTADQTRPESFDNMQRSRSSFITVEIHRAVWIAVSLAFVYISTFGHISLTGEDESLDEEARARASWSIVPVQLTGPSAWTPFADVEWSLVNTSRLLGLGLCDWTAHRIHTCRSA